jgi:peptide/nickel transport system substrate-binding protein
MLAFIAGRFDMTFPTEVSVPLLKDVQTQAPDAICVLAPQAVSVNLIINRDKPPFDNADLRMAMTLTVDRQAFVDILSEGKGNIGAAMLPGPEGVWGMPEERLRTLPGYSQDVEKSRAEARKLMEKNGYGPEKRLAVKISTRNIPVYRDPAVILIDHLKQIYIDGELEVVETANWDAKVSRKDYAVGLNLTGSSVDDPDQNLYENYACGSARNYSGYCNKELQADFDRQSQMTDIEARKKLVWDIDAKLQQDVARPIIYHLRSATCWQPYVKGYSPMVNSSYTGYRFDGVWLDK